MPAQPGPHPRFSLIPAAYVVLRRAGPAGREVLLQWRSGTGFTDEHWACAAAGHVEAGESVLRAACREAHEELGITIAEGDLIPLCVMHRRHSPAPIDQRVDVFFACDSWEGEPSVREPGKSGGLDWFPLDRLPTPVVPHEWRVLDGLANGELPHLLVVGFD